MAEETKDTQPAPSPSVWGIMFRKFIFITVVLLIAWIVFGQIAPRYLFPQMQNITVPSPADTPQATMPMEPPQEKDERLEALTQRLDQLEARLKTYEDIIAATPKLAESDLSIRPEDAKPAEPLPEV